MLLNTFKGTGVSYVNLTRSQVVRTIQRWPGRGQNNETKVPTVLCYPRGSSRASSWGFVSESELESIGGDKEYVDWFKNFLDDKVLRAAQKKAPEHCPRSMSDVEKWYVDYMSHLYQHIKSKLGSIAELPSDKTWESSTIEFIFSVPTTWLPHTVERFRALLVRAGYNRYPRHSIAVGFTEAEAAAVCTSIDAPGLFQKDESILVCDAGGGTTDLTLLKIAEMAGSAITLTQLDVVRGRWIGSVNIDVAFEELMASRLKEADRVQPLGIDPDAAALLLMKRKDFQNAKCDFGSPDDPPLFSLPVPGVHPSYVNEPLNISQASIRFSADDLRDLFDEQVRLLLDTIDRQIINFQNRFPSENLTHLVISGGLGNSPYVQSCIKSRYANGASNLPAATNIQIHVASDPQLVVSRGIILDRMRKLTAGKAVLGWRCCRASYGIVAKEVYRRKNPNHADLPRVRDEVNGKEYIENVVAWLIKKGEPVNVDTPIAHHFCRIMPLSDATRIFPTRLAVSYVNTENIPYRMNESKNLCRYEEI
jgi:hypothetical protein